MSLVLVPSETPEPKVFSADQQIIFIFQTLFAVLTGIFGLENKCKKKLNPQPT